MQSDREGFAAAAAGAAGGGVEVASELSGEGGHSSVFPTPSLVSPLPLPPPSLLPRTPREAEYKGGVRLEGKVNVKD